MLHTYAPLFDSMVVITEAVDFMNQGAAVACEEQGVSSLLMLLVQAQGANGAKLRYTGMTDVLRKTVQADGFKGLYRVSHHVGLCNLGCVSVVMQCSGWV